MDEEEKKELSGTPGPGGPSDGLCWEYLLSHGSDRWSSTNYKDERKKSGMRKMEEKLKFKKSPGGPESQGRWVSGLDPLCTCPPCFCLGWPMLRAAGEAGEPRSCQSHTSSGECPILWGGQRCAPSSIHTPNEQENSHSCHWPWQDSGTEQGCRRGDLSDEILAICRTTDPFLWALPRWLILSRPNMLIGAGAQPALLYPLAGHHHIPTKQWKSKETEPKQKLNCVLRRKIPLLPAGNLRKPYGTSSVNKNWTSDLFLVPLETVASQGLAAFIVLPQISIMRDTGDLCGAWRGGKGRTGRDQRDPWGAWQGGKLGWFVYWIWA